MLLEQLLEFISSSTRSLINPPKIRQIFKSRLNTEISEDSISMFLSWLEDAFLIQSSKRFDIKGRKYINSPFKYYLLDCGLRNVMLNFRQNKENHIMENIIFNELLIWGYSVDVGLVE